MNRNIDISPDEIEAFEQYIQGLIPEDEKDAFANRLTTDPEFLKKFETFRLILVGIQETELKNKIEVFHQNLISSTKNTTPASVKLNSVKKWLVAASIVVIAGIGSLLFLNQDTKEEKIFASFYKPDPGLISAMSTSENYLFDRAMIDYKIGKYDAALKTWESMLVLNPENDTLNYFIGSAYLAEKKNELAINHFQKVIANPNSYFLNDALWYSGLILLKEDKILEAIPFIEKSEHHGKESLLLRLKEMK